MEDVELYLKTGFARSGEGITMSPEIVSLTKTRTQDLLSYKHTYDSYNHQTCTLEEAREKCAPFIYLNSQLDESFSNETFIQMITALFERNTLKKLLVHSMIYENVIFIDLPDDIREELCFISPSDFNALPLNMQQYLGQYIYRAYSIANEPATYGPDVYFSTPVSLFSTISNTTNFEYLSHVPGTQKPLVYELGIVAHEIGHHIFTYILQRSHAFMSKWEYLISQNPPVTQYAGQYIGQPQYLNESLAESIMLYTVSVDYFKNNFSAIYAFIDELNDSQDLGINVLEI